MKLRCFFNRHPWNYRTFGEIALRVCRAGCNSAQYWAEGEWKPFEALGEETVPTEAARGGIQQTLRVGPGMEARLTDY